MFIILSVSLPEPQCYTMAILQFTYVILLFNLVHSISAYHELEGRNPVVVITDGKIRGRSLESQQKKEFYAFQQIPYATPPIGKLRFKNPVPPQKWSGILNATENTRICYQERVTPREDEDCLYLNVYTPWIGSTNGTTMNLLPVYVYIHGGHLIYGDGSYEAYGPEFLMDYGIILVTLNYRLGPFGFLSTGDNTIAGNMGLKDQLLALKWVKDNIRSFGGDPNRVTLGGVSAGAAAVAYHILSPQSAGLFGRATLESGSALCSVKLQKHPRYFANQLAFSLEVADFSNNASSHLLHVLQKASAEAIRNNSDIEIPEELRNSVGNEENKIWAPVIDGSFVVGAMHENFKRGRFNAVPILMGINSEEQIYYDLKELKSKAGYFDSNNSYLVNGNLNIREENKCIVGKKLKSIYTNDSFEKEFGAFVRFASDAKYTTAIARQADLMSHHVSVYFYQFSYHGELNNNNQGFVEGAEKVGHSEELNYLFKRANNIDLQKIPKRDLEMQHLLLKMWTDFIKHADPAPTDLKWPQVKPGKFSYMNINSTFSIEQDPREYQKWRGIYDKYADEYQETY